MKKSLIILLLIFIIGSLAGIVGYSNAKITTFEGCENSWLLRSITLYDYAEYVPNAIEKKCTLWAGKSFVKLMETNTMSSVTDITDLLKTGEGKTGTEALVQAENIVSITKTGGLPSILKPKVLYPQKDIETINKIVGIINSGINKRDADKDEIESLKYGYPRPLTIETKDSQTIRIWNVYKMFRKEIQNGFETTRELYTDRFIMSVSKDGQEKYYTVYSQEVAEYLRNGIEKDIPDN